MELNLWWIVGLIIVYAICLVLAKLSRHVGIAIALMIAANAAVVVFMVYAFSR